MAFTMLQKIAISNSLNGKCCSFEFSIHQKVLKNFHKNIMPHNLNIDVNNKHFLIKLMQPW